MGEVRAPGATPHPLCGSSPQGEPHSTPVNLAPEGSNGEEAKSVKKRAALLHVLAFCFLDLLFGVPRGEQPLGRGSLPRNSETFFASFFGHKKGRSPGSMTLTKARRRRVAASGSAKQIIAQSSCPPPRLHPPASPLRAASHSPSRGTLRHPAAKPGRRVCRQPNRRGCCRRNRPL